MLSGWNRNRIELINGLMDKDNMQAVHKRYTESNRWVSRQERKKDAKGIKVNKHAISRNNSYVVGD